MPVQAPVNELPNQWISQQSHRPGVLQRPGRSIAALVVSILLIAGCDSGAMSDAPASQAQEAPVSGAETEANTSVTDEPEPELASAAEAVAEANTGQVAADADADTEADAQTQADEVVDSALAMPAGLPVIDGLEIAAVGVLRGAVTATGRYDGELEQLTTAIESAMSAGGWVPSPDDAPETWMGTSRSWQRDESRAVLLVWPEQGGLGVQFSRSAIEGA